MKSLKVCSISDSHQHPLPKILEGVEADILIIAGDWSMQATFKEIADFKEGLKAVRPQFGSVVIISGNHEVGIANNPNLMQEIEQECNIKYLCNSFTSVMRYYSDAPVEAPDEYVYIYGSPYTPKFGGWAYMGYPDEMQKNWARVPEGLDILVSHGPPFGILDTVDTLLGPQSVGCEELRKRLDSMDAPPSVVLFGHIHRNHGSFRWVTSKGKMIDCYNVAVVGEDYQIKCPPTIFYI